MNDPKRLALTEFEVDAANPYLQILEKQRLAFLAKGAPSYEQRIASLQRLRASIVRHKEDIVEAVEADFGHRSRHETLLADVVGLLGEIRHNRTHLKRWMKPRKAGFSPQFPLARARILCQPRGVIGIIGAWNVPVLLTLSPLVGALSAGNRAMIKTSEFCPKTAVVIKRIVEAAFDESEVAVINGDAQAATWFSALPFDHVIFTGSTRIGKLVMKAAAEHLTPVTLELGGKSPTIISDDYPLDTAAERIVQGKMLNAGQACIAPDYIFVPTNKKDQLIEALRNAYGKSYPNLATNQDMTWIVDNRHFQRLRAHVQDARDKGAEAIEINPGDMPIPEGKRIFPLTILLGVTDDMTVMQAELFGPILPLKTYDDIDKVVQYVNSHPHPLALYYFDNDRIRAEKMMDRTLSGGACVNDTLFHVMHERLPFGGVGTSGVGRYNGEEGFRTFSHQKSVLYQGAWSVQQLLRPPFGPRMQRVIDLMIKYL